jgi:hypothetical protein
MRLPLSVCLAVLAAAPLQAAAPVNAGLPTAFFAEPAPDTLYRFETRIHIDDSSLETGVVRTHTCHYNLDPIDRVDIVFAADRVRSIKVVSSHGIGTVSAGPSEVRLEKVSRGAGICIDLTSRSLEREGGGWVLSGGPLQRRFLDTFHPMAVEGTVILETPRLRYRAMEPAAQPGWEIRAGNGLVAYRGHFAGLLRTRIQFDTVSALATAAH